MCEHPRGEQFEDRNERGTVIMFHCPDCGLTMGINPQQLEEWAAKFPVKP